MNTNGKKKYFEVGKNFFNLTKSKKAIYWLKKHIQTNPYDYEAYSMLGLASLWVDRSKQSITYYKKAFEIGGAQFCPTDYFYLALAYLNLNKKKKAMVYLIKGFKDYQKEGWSLMDFFELLETLINEGYKKYQFALTFLCHMLSPV